jgi:hypothetical protein
MDGIARRTAALDRALQVLHRLLPVLRLQRRMLAVMATRMRHACRLQDELRDRFRSLASDRKSTVPTLPSRPPRAPTAFESDARALCSHGFSNTPLPHRPLRLEDVMCGMLLTLLLRDCLVASGVGRRYRQGDCRCNLCDLSHTPRRRHPTARGQGPDDGT